MTKYRELLEFAAKAAGMELIDWNDCWADFGPGYRYELADGTRECWNPLTDDGDALRLAVKLGMYLEIDRPNTRASALPEQDNMEFKRERFNGDPCNAMRLAIVRCAAEIGKAVP